MTPILSLIDPIHFQIPIPVLAAGSGTVLALMAWLSWHFLSRRRFRDSLEKAMATPSGATVWFRDRYSRATILRRSELVEEFAKKKGNSIVAITGIDDLWIEELKTRGRKRDFRRVLQYAPEKGLFPCFLAAMEKEELVPELTGWLSSEGQFLPLRRLALSCAGESFDGRRALPILGPQMDQIRELAGDPEWTVRLFVVAILIHDTGNENSHRSLRIVQEAMRDPRPELRSFAVEHLSQADRNWLFGELFRTLLRDPVFDVRRLARDRIQHEFLDLYRLDAKELEHEEVVHALELLRPDVPEDQAFAFHFLDGDNLETRLPAARFLDRTGVLKRLAIEVNAGDREIFERNHRLLRKAMEVNAAGFLSLLDESENPASLHLIGELLLESRNRSMEVARLARRTFAIYRRQPELADLYMTVMKCIGTHGNADSFALLNGEFLKWEADTDMMHTLLSSLPKEAGEAVRDTLFRFLKSPGFSAPKDLVDYLTGLPATILLSDLLDIVKSEKDAHPIPVRKRALQVLTGLKLPYCLQSILELLPLFDPQEVQELVGSIAEYPEENLDFWIGRYLAMDDGRLRAALILALPALREKKFLKEIKSALKDSDPEVRIAAVHSLVVLKDAEILGEESPVLRDPVERVRKESARIIGGSASEKVVKKFRAILEDDDESTSVRIAAIQGLGHSPHTATLEILTNLLEQKGEDPVLKEAIIDSLALKTDKKELKRLVELFKDATPRLREDLTQAFRRMGDTGAGVMKDLLQEDIPSLRPFILEVLESSGSIESHIRLLRHRDPALRREAARFLSSVSSLSSFRGLVMAAQDPDEEVRVLVIKALEKLETEDSGVLLNELMNDPDRRVRKYTHWALERLKVKGQ